MYKIYLDNCCYNRPFDEQTQIRIQMETMAKLHIQTQVKKGVYRLVWSYILDYENARNPYEDKRAAILPWRYIAAETVSRENEAILALAERLQADGIKPYDALHVSCAVYAGCDYFLTTDRKLERLQIPQIKIRNPVTFLHELEG